MRTRTRRMTVAALAIAGLLLAACDRAPTQVAEPEPTVATSEPTVATSEIASELGEANVLLEFAPAAVGQSPDGPDALVPALLRVTPPTADTPLQLERRSKKGWEPVATAVTDDHGEALVHIDAGPVGKRARYRAVVRSAADKMVAASDPVAFVNREPVWRDEFDGAALDEEKWEHRQTGQRNPQGNRACAEGHPSAVSVGDGQVHFRVSEIPPEDAQGEDQRGDCPHGEFYNGHIGTRGKFAFKYGTLAARIKFPHAQGQHGAFWSQPNKFAAGAEIDAVEYFGDEFPAKGDLAGSSAVQHSIYWHEDGEVQKVGGLHDLRHLLPAGETWADDFHIYSVEWTPEEYIFRVDGHETFRTSAGLSDVRQYLILSLLTSDWELPRLDPSDLTPMSVDWVRIWRPVKN